MGACGVATAAFAEAPSVSGVERVAVAAEGGVAVEWTRPPGPVPVLGWHVERQLPGGGALRLTATRVAAGLFDSPATVYRFQDAGASARAGDRVAYRLVAVDPELREWPGDFAEQTVLAAEAAPSAAPAETSRSKAAPVRLAAAAATIGSRVRIVVTNDGLYRLSAASIAAVLQGYSEAQVAAAIAQTNLALSCGGEPVAWRGEAGGGALLFFGQAYRDPYADQNVYWLAPGAGLAMEAAVRTTAAVAAAPWFWETAHAERDLYFTPYVPGAAEDDYFVWAGQQLSSPSTSWTWSTNVVLTDPYSGVKTGTVTAHLISAYDGTPALDNRTRLWAAGQLLNDRQWAGDARLTQTGAATNLGAATVAVTVESRRESGVTTTTVLIDALDVVYARQMRARNNLLLFRPEAGTNALTVRGFTVADIQVFDVSDPLRPVELTGTVAAEGVSEWRVSWTVDPALAGRYLVAGTHAQPARMDGVSDAGWSSPQAGASHVVIAPRALTNAAAALVAHRRQQGLNSILVPLEDLYDAFAFGRRDPRAIPRFLAYARAQWSEPPAYVCLAGDGHLDYFDHFGQAATRPNHVPPLQERIPYDASPSGTMVTLGLDNSLADLDGDGGPDLPIGRLPAQTAAALTAMINRIVAHEAADEWKNRILLVSDRDEEDAFGAARQRLAAQVPPGLAVTPLGHTLSTPVDTMRTNFIRDMNSGPVLAVYFGHANNIGISSPYFFEHSFIRSYMSALTNWARAPLFLAGTCMLNDFAAPHPDNRCLGKGFLDTATGGTVAIWASAAEATLATAEATAGAIFDELFTANDGRLGDLIRPALELQAHSASPWTVRSSVLLGDPGTRIRTHLFLDHTPPAIQITDPPTGENYATTTNRLTLSGTAFDLNGITRVVIRNNRISGESVAAGTTNWTKAGLMIAEGTNGISAVAADSAGNTATDTLQVVYTPIPVLAVMPSSREVTSAAGTATFAVTNTGDGKMVYTASAAESWLAITSGADGTNGGTVMVSYAANGATAVRTGTVVVAATGASGSPARVTVVQAAQAVNLAISPASTNLSSAAASGKAIGVTANTSWTAATNVPWLAITGGASGTTDGTVTFSVASNGTASVRTGLITVAGSGLVRTCTVVQAAGSAGFATRRINCGGGATGGWAADTGYSGGTAKSTAAAIANATGAPPAVYQTRRYAPTLTYSFPDVPDGTYTIRLHFAELYSSAAGQRKFNVSIEGQTKLTNFDIYQEAGGKNRAVVRIFENVAVSGGLQIQGVAAVDAAQFNGIEIDAAGPPTPAIVTAVAQVTVPEGATATFGVHLDTAPEGAATVTVTRASGDTDLAVSGGASLVFTPANYGADQTVTLAAAEDADTTAGTAAIQCTAPGYTAAGVTAAEQDNDVPAFSLKVNCGGPAVAGAAPWLADTGYSGGTAKSTAAAIANATGAPPAVYQTRRYAPTLTYSFPDVPDGTYTIRLHFAELYSSAAGQRKFNVSIEGQTKLTNFDIYQEAGGKNRAVVRIFENVAVSGGLQIQGVAAVDAAQFNGIEIDAAGPPTPAIVTAVAQVTVPEGATATFGVHLDTAPEGAATVTVTRASGDTDLAVSGGASLVFTPANYGADQTVTLAAAEDADTTAGTAAIQCTAPGYTAAGVTAAEQDNDVPAFSLKVNCGGPALTGDWVADTGYLNGGAWSTASSVANATLAPMALYQRERSGAPLRYSLTTVPNGTYLVRLHFNEMSTSARAGSRVFNVYLEGTLAEANLDVYALAGGSLRALVRSYSVTVAGGNGLQIELTKVAGYPQLNGIEVVAGGAVAKRAYLTKSSVVWPRVEARSGDSPWAAAPELVDGDTNTLWIGAAGATSWAIALDFGECIALQNLDVFCEKGSWTKVGVMGTPDLREWRDLSLSAAGPVPCRALYFYFPDDGSGHPPAIREIQWLANPAF